VPAHLDLGASYEQKSMFQEALVEFKSCATLSGDRPFYLAAVAEAYGRLGRKEEASKILSHLHESSNGEYVSPNDLCLVYAALGEKNKAFAWLETAYEQRDASLVWIKVAPESDALRSGPRFASFLRRMNFPAR
jgi:tetratricopeptide (TPR) repeat protein